MRRLRLTEEDRQAIVKRRLEARAKLSLAFQLGFYVGEQIVNRYLPTLSVDSIQTRKVISVTNDEQHEATRLKDIWFDKAIAFKGTDVEKEKATKEEWNALRTYHEMLEEKYLPKTIECHFSLLNVTENDMEEFKKGISISLWDCDCSHYSVKEENIGVVADDEGMFTVITLVRE